MKKLTLIFLILASMKSYSQQQNDTTFFVKRKELYMAIQHIERIPKDCYLYNELMVVREEKRRKKNVIFTVATAAVWGGLTVWFFHK